MQVPLPSILETEPVAAMPQRRRPAFRLEQREAVFALPSAPVQAKAAREPLFVLEHVADARHHGSIGLA